MGDDGATARGSGRIRTLDALLPALLHRGRGVLAPSSTPPPTARRTARAASTPREPTYDPRRYWRGSAWPQLTYLLWLAATSSGSDAARSALARSIVAGAARSGYAEHWVADTGAPLGAVPQTWSTLAVAVARR